MKTKSQDRDYLSWDEYFIGIAQLSAMRSKDPNTQVGACIVSADNRILSVGYNGAPNGYSDHDFPWDKRKGERYETKYPYVCHAELNAILNFRGNMRELQDAKIYVYYFPCNECAKAIIQSGIKQVIYSYNYDHDGHDQEMQASIRMFDQCGISYRQFKPSRHQEIVLKLKD